MYPWTVWMSGLNHNCSWLDEVTRIFQHLPIISLGFDHILSSPPLHTGILEAHTSTLTVLEHTGALFVTVIAYMSDLTTQNVKHKIDYSTLVVALALVGLRYIDNPTS